MGQSPGAKGHNAQQKAQGKTDAERYVELRAKGHSVRAIARMKGVSHSTVSLRISEELKAPAPALEELRALENEKYDRWERELHALKQKKKDDAEVVVSVHARLARIAELRTRLNGIAVPVKTDPDLIVSTAATAAAATAAAVESRPAAPVIQIVLASDVAIDE